MSEIKEHQTDALRTVESNGLYHKISDDSFAAKPFDCFWLVGEAYVVIAFGKQLKYFYMIRRDRIDEFRSLDMKSISEEVAAKEGVRYELKRR